MIKVRDKIECCDFLVAKRKATLIRAIVRCLFHERKNQTTMPSRRVGS